MVVKPEGTSNIGMDDQTLGNKLCLSACYLLQCKLYHHHVMETEEGEPERFPASKG